MVFHRVHIPTSCRKLLHKYLCRPPAGHMAESQDLEEPLWKPIFLSCRADTTQPYATRQGPIAWGGGGEGLRLGRAGAR